MTLSNKKAHLKHCEAGFVEGTGEMSNLWADLELISELKQKVFTVFFTVDFINLLINLLPKKGSLFNNFLAH